MTVVTPPVGRTRITPRALDRLVAAVTAEALGVDAKRVGVTLTDERGDLVMTVTTPVRVVSLPRVSSDTGVVSRTGGTLLERGRRAQEEIRRRVAELSGSTVTRVVVRISGVDIREETRVR